LRSSAEKVILDARTAAEAAAAVALDVLAVDRDAPFGTMDETARNLRLALRARARALGAGVLAAGLSQLVEEVAYEQWHRMLFARFLAENGLLRHPAGVSVTLEECTELAAEEGEPDAWGIAAKYAAAMLPGIFRNDDPAVRIRLAPEGRAALEQQLRGLPRPLFTADDGLGWIYQFWQSKKKDEVNASGSKIGGANIAPVTQLFTEDYMVRFLLENTLGAWWAARHSTSPLLKEWEYLRYRDDGTPAAGTFPGWPERAAAVTVMDPCCGSGHFLVVAFFMLLHMRMEEEGLDEAAAADAVVRDNLFGLEIDPRCTQIAVFALVLAAWKAGGHRQLPLPNIACSGIPVEGQLDDWTRLADSDTNLRFALERLHGLFRQAPDLGSLMNPSALPANERMFVADYLRVAPILDQALEREQSADPAAAVFGAIAQGVARAADFLSRSYTLVTTNVPYLGARRQSDRLRSYLEATHPDAKADLATAFVKRCRAFVAVAGSYALVTPQNWLFLGSYKELRNQLLQGQSWQHVSRLGSGAFDMISGEIVNVALLILTNAPPPASHVMTGVDASGPHGATAKAALLRAVPLQQIEQTAQLRNPDARLAVQQLGTFPHLSKWADGLKGIVTADDPRFARCFWELERLSAAWVAFQGTVEETRPFGGREYALLYEDGNGQLRRMAAGELRDRRRDRQGNQAWGRRGVVVSMMSGLPVTLYTGELFHQNATVILPKNPVILPAIWEFCKSVEFREAVRQIDQSLKVTNATLVKVPFDLDRWQRVAKEAGPLPEPYSNDPTQWLFKGTVTDSTEPLHVTVARLLGYAWPEQVADELSQFSAEDGILSLVPLPGVQQGAERLRALLATAYGAEWSAATQETLLAGAGYAGRSLDAWLREGFFEQHCRIFHNRPFLWQIWDGRPDGFSVIVNYHRLDGALLDKLTYTYLGAWIEQQRAAAGRGEAGADGRLVAALTLQEKLKRIREGEPPYDVYVRWKPLHQQPLGWEPDLDDGVRMNIRPFVEAGVLRRKFTINWNKDRGANPDGSERRNDLHYTLEEKRHARATAGVPV